MRLGLFQIDSSPVIPIGYNLSNWVLLCRFFPEKFYRIGLLPGRVEKVWLHVAGPRPKRLLYAIAKSQPFSQSTEQESRRPNSEEYFKKLMGKLQCLKNWGCAILHPTPTHQLEFGQSLNLSIISYPINVFHFHTSAFVFWSICTTLNSHLFNIL